MGGFLPVVYSLVGSGFQSPPQEVTPPLPALLCATGPGDSTPSSSLHEDTFWWRNTLQEDPGGDSSSSGHRVSSYPSCLFLTQANSTSSNRFQSHLGFKAFSSQQQDLLQTRLSNASPPAPHHVKPCPTEKTKAGLYHRVHTHTCITSYAQGLTRVWLPEGDSPSEEQAQRGQW